MNIQRKVVLALLVTGVALAVGLRAWLHPPLHLQAAELLPQPKSLAGYGFTVEGNRVGFDLLKGRWALVYLGYTSCPDVCPLELKKLAQMLKQFDASGKEAPAVVFVSVDPERDNAETLKKYVAFFDEHIFGITGSNAEVAALAGVLGATYNRTATIQGQDYLVSAGADMPAGAGDHYLVNHSSRIFILDDRVRYIGSFPPPHDVATLFSDMQQLMRHGSQP